jgi:hypothetical protein
VVDVLPGFGVFRTSVNLYDVTSTGNLFHILKVFLIIEVLYGVFPCWGSRVGTIQVGTVSCSVVLICGRLFCFVLFTLL